MKDALVLAVLSAMLLTAQTAAAQVFKCQGQAGKIEYQSTPCAGNTQQHSVDLIDDSPSRTDALRAQQRAQSDKYKASAIDAERERSRRLAVSEHDRRYAEKEAKARKCAEYEERAKKLDARSETWFTKQYRDDDKATAKALEDKHFSECFAR